MQPFETPGNTNSETLLYIPEELNLHTVDDSRGKKNCVTELSRR
jgi:hypothetical protein